MNGSLHTLFAMAFISATSESLYLKYNTSYTTSRLVTQCESLQGFRNPSRRSENDAIVIEAEPRSLLCHSCPDCEDFKIEERLALVTNRLRKCC